jgi:uncharacterized circularly permuted ATP-grasp superfamily protein
LRVDSEAGHEAATAYNDLVAHDPRAALEQAAWLESAFERCGVVFGGAPMRSFLRPHFVERAAWDALRDAGRRLVELAARVARQAFHGDAARLCAFLGTPEDEARWIRPDPGEPDVVLSRLDAFLGDDGPRFIEINSDAPAGFGYADRMAEIFRELPLLRRFARGRRLSCLPSGPRVVEAVLGAWARSGGSGPPTVAIADWSDVKTRADQEILREAFASDGVRCLLVDPREMEVRSGRLWAGADRVDVVYRRALLQELLQREAEVRGFLTACRDRLAVFVNSFRCRLSEDKAFLALLTDEDFSSLLGEEERAFVSRAVPWTRRIVERRTSWRGRAIDLVPFAIENRSQLVLKPAHDYGGRSVFVGDETDPGTWQQAVLAGVGGAWVVQERVAIPREAFPVCEAGVLRFEPLNINVSPFYVAGAEVGAVTRASRASVINVSAGGGSVPTFVLETR